MYIRTQRALAVGVSAVYIRDNHNGVKHSVIMPTYANGYKQAVLKTDEPKGL